ncbi:hypothetical protein SIL08_09370 [Scandinavium sp. V105_16]|uniref:Probable fimbrial chaperone EcpB n=1 Tax=Scandinavium lactucae TaxID=3095028 RepID=A0AAJ2S051_9ENTR|nr:MULTISPECIES: hypothetical protein [unclassified Scandinavium]MDX6020482.1 hypothetical protein [Scandinavium sp. V105_16]MDX6031966.1 hypothetical protein [Scandinavium sp. V105_12]MDX6039836.1 hypothetical protein [Scandinavium sp. V105_6]MDX6051431.1 hypothetical protein [Scandinavium sp. V105_1]
MTTLFISSQVMAMGISAPTAEINPATNKVSIAIDNPDTKSAHLITINVDKIDSPYTGKSLKRANDEVLYTPSKLLLSPGQKARIQFNYKGPKDDTERYYAIKWQDEAISSSDHPDSQKVTQVMAVAKISTILVAPPINPNYSAKYDSGKNGITNSGNVSFKAVAYGDCIKPSPETNNICQENSYVGPGREYVFKMVKISSKHSSLGFWQGNDFKTVNK